MDKYLINPNHKISKINKDIYGHFAEHLGRCIYEGIYVGENSKIPNVNGMRIDVVNALKDMGIPVLRWPGGCFADEYHWKDGIGDKANRKKMINTHWGGVVEDNSFGTHEYFELCRQLGCDTYINGNVGSGSVKEMNEWVEYMTAFLQWLSLESKTAVKSLGKSTTSASVTSRGAAAVIWTLNITAVFIRDIIHTFVIITAIIK